MTAITPISPASVQRVAQRFAAAATGYDRAALAQRESALWLLEQVQADGQVLDVGCGTGWLTRQLAEQPAVQQVWALDIADGMLASPTLQHPAIQPVQADAAWLPFAEASFDWVVSNFALQWLSEPECFAQQLQRILRPGGQFALALPVRGSLYELRQAWSQVDGHEHINTFLEPLLWRQALQTQGLQVCSMDSRSLFQYYPSVRELLRGLKDIGANEVLAGRTKSLWGAGRLRQLEQAMQVHATAQGLPLRYEVCLLRGQRPVFA